jgi:uncharacterized membrane protein YtjA (UPF0391 family)
MFQVTTICLIIAVVAALMGFGGIAGPFTGAAKILFVIFAVFALIWYLGGEIRKGRLLG